jgi:pimeloyl-ACP methyl ester carboxylesterase
LTRTGADFDTLAGLLAADPQRPRQVIALDARGRGRSDRDPAGTTYTFQAELDDVLQVLAALEIGRAIVLGSSRGGILTMLLATARPTVLAGAILNDIGPVIEPTGLLRLKSYVGKLPTPRDMREGALILRRLFEGQFPKAGEADWLRAAGRAWDDKDGRLVPTYDPQLARTLDGIEPDRPVPALWKEFDALGRIPLMVIRGENSDVLTAATVAAMRTRRPDLVAWEVPDEGHTPTLEDRDTVNRIAAFVADCD